MSYLEQVFGLQGRSALLTGASSGIGEHWAWTLARSGISNLGLAARRVDRLNQLATEIQQKHPSCQVKTVAMDVGKDRSAIVSSLDKLLKDMELEAFDVLINNAGIGPPGHVLSASEQDYNATMNINARGPFFLSQECANRWISKKKREQGQGATKVELEDPTRGSMSIINVSSILGIRAGKLNSQYAMSKAALISMTKAMAMELVQQHVRVNAIAPGYYQSELTEEFYKSEKGKKYLDTKVPSKRLGRLQELDGALLLLASDAGSNMTGSVVVVDGGHVVSGL